MKLRNNIATYTFPTTMPLSSACMHASKEVQKEIDVYKNNAPELVPHQLAFPKSYFL